MLGKTLDNLTTRYDIIILMGDFNSEPNETNMQSFLNLYHLKALIQEKTCFKNTENPSWIDLILTNCSISFENSGTYETILSDSHKMAVSVLKSIFQNGNRALSCIVIIKVSITKYSGQILKLSYQNVIFIIRNASKCFYRGSKKTFTYEN